MSADNTNKIGLPNKDSEFYMEYDPKNKYIKEVNEFLASIQIPVRHICHQRISERFPIFTSQDTKNNKK